MADEPREGFGGRPHGAWVAKLGFGAWYSTMERTRSFQNRGDGRRKACPPMIPGANKGLETYCEIYRYKFHAN